MRRVADAVVLAGVSLAVIALALHLWFDYREEAGVVIGNTAGIAVVAAPSLVGVAFVAALVYFTRPRR